MKYLRMVHGAEEKFHDLCARSARERALAAGGRRTAWPVSIAFRTANGIASITDGPFAETKELSAGLSLIEIAAMRAAIRGRAA